MRWEILPKKCPNTVYKTTWATQNDLGKHIQCNWHLKWRNRIPNRDFLKRNLNGKEYFRRGLHNVDKRMEIGDTKYAFSRKNGNAPSVIIYVIYLAKSSWRCKL